LSGQVLDFNQAKKQGEAPRNGVDADDIRARLHADPRAFVQWLYSGRALITKSEARIGNAYGEPGASLSIQLAGKDAGLWYDHATDERGDLIALYRASMGYTGTANFVLSLKEIAKDFFGDPVEVERSAWQPSAMERIEQKKAKLGTKPRQDMVELGAPVATYKYYDTRGNVLASVVRFEPDGTRESKTFRPFCFKTIDGVTKWVAGAPDLRPLYRLPDIATATTVVLCEGEGCADALVAVGIPATTAMQGAKAPIDKTDWSPLAGKKVIVWPDNDEAGFAYAKAAADRLSALGCTVLGITPPSDVRPKWDAADCVADGRDVHAIIAGASPVTTTKAKPRIQLLDIDEIEDLAPPTWLVDGILTDNGLSVLWGRSGAMKSFVALDIGLCIATGAPWHGHKVKHGPVVYLAAEGSHGLGRRAVGWRRTRGRELAKPLFKLIPQAVALTGDDLDAMTAAILELPGPRPILIIIDTLARTFGSGDENKQADMNAYVSAADRLREATGASIMIIHHSGVHEEKRERGSNVLRGAADTVIKVSRKNDNLDIINQAPEGKQKDAEEFKTVKLTTRKVHFEQANVEQSTLVLNLREDDGPAEPDGTAQGDRLGKNEQAIINALTKANQPLGFMRLAAMTNINRGSLTRSLDNLVEKNLISIDLDASGNAKQWSVICS
jgi:hypothetical protein